MPSIRLGVGFYLLDRYAWQVLEVMTRGPRYVLGVADQVPPNGLRSRVARVTELVERYGVYHA
jgi:hypothetical protein